MRLFQESTLFILQPCKKSHAFLFKSKNQKRDPSALGFRMTRKGEFTKILEQPQILKRYERCNLNLFPNFYCLFAFLNGWN